jgi:hypothetical protein
VTNHRPAALAAAAESGEQETAAALVGRGGPLPCRQRRLDLVERLAVDNGGVVVLNDNPIVCRRGSALPLLGDFAAADAMILAASLTIPTIGADVRLTGQNFLDRRG